MENIGLYNLVRELKALNPSVKFDFYDQTKSPVDIIFGTAPAESLSYPEGYYWNEKNGITDKPASVNATPKKSFFARLFSK